jgi:catechol 2,3-dioxygenase-like lactoylglutathione lyase family enzyme
MISGLVWGGTRTENFDATVRFFEDVMGLERDEQQPGFVSFKLTNGDKFEVFGPADTNHSFFTTGPVIGFGVGDVDAERARLEAAGIEFVAPTQGEGGYRWAHFRGPDGNIYELTSS